MRECRFFLIIIFIVAIMGGCADTTSHSRGVYMLLDTSGTYKAELVKAQSIISYLLGVLQPGDSQGVARIDTGSFSEKDIIAKVTYDRRPSVANRQKRAFHETVNTFVSTVKGSPYTDITGGVLQAAEYLNEACSGKKYILIFSDLKEELVKGYIRDFPIDLKDFHVIALNVTKLRSDNKDPREYKSRLEYWKKRVEDGGGHFRVINDIERLDSILEEKA